MSLALDDQLCFPVYALSRAIQQRYRPLLEPLGLTYTQYLVLLVLWEQDGLPVRDIGGRLHLDSGTLTPLLKRLEAYGLLQRRRSTEDGRVVHIHLTERGLTLKERATDVPQQLLSCVQPPEGLDLPGLQRQLKLLLTTLTDPPAGSG